MPADGGWAALLLKIDLSVALFAPADKRRDDSLSRSSGSDSEEEFSDEQEDEEDYRRGEWCHGSASCPLASP